MRSHSLSLCRCLKQRHLLALRNKPDGWQTSDAAVQCHSPTLSSDESEYHSDSELPVVKRSRTSVPSTSLSLFSPPFSSRSATAKPPAIRAHTTSESNTMSSRPETYTPAQPSPTATPSVSNAHKLSIDPPAPTRRAQPLPTRGPATPATAARPALTSVAPYLASDKIRNHMIAPASPPPAPPPFLSLDDLARGRGNIAGIMTQFPRYSAGTPSRQLYVKNLPKAATAADLAHVFGLFLPPVSAQPTPALAAGHPIQPSTATDTSGIQLGVGRLRHQAFVTFADEESAMQAIRAVHGFLLRGKPMIVSFAKLPDRP